MIGASPAAAETLPRYAVEDYCREVADFSGGSSMMFNGCIDMEQGAYNKLKASWGRVPASTAAYCMEVAEFGGESYSMLDGCISMELDAASDPGTFKY